MKTFLVATDFSATAQHAAGYAYAFAKQVNADLLICNAVIVPAEVPMASAMVWPIDECENLLENSLAELKKLKSNLELSDVTGSYKPQVRCFNEAGTLNDIVGQLVASQKVRLTIIGTHGTRGLNQFILGNHSRDFINHTTTPLLLVPGDAPARAVRRIAFAADFKKPDQDLAAIYSLIELARTLNAEILLTYVCDTTYESPEFQAWINQFIADLSSKSDYTPIFYRIIRNKHVVLGLDWLCEHGQIDMLAMVHRSKSFMENLFRGSHTQRMAQHIPVPLLVFSGQL